MYHMRKFALILLLIIAILLPEMAMNSFANENAFSNNVGVRRITMYDGLPANGVRNVLQDKHGFIWFGTDNGLCRYNGYAMQTFYNPYTKFDQFISALYDAGEDLIVGTANGTYLFNFRTEQFTPLCEKIRGNVSCIAEDKEDNIWVGTSANGIYRYNRNQHALTHYPMKQWKGCIGSLLVSDDNQIWTMTIKLHGLPYRLNKNRDQFDPVHLQGEMKYLNGMSMIQMADGKILAGTWEDGLVTVTPDGYTKRLVPPSLSATTGNYHIHKLYMYSPYEVYIGSDDGLMSYNLQTNSYKPLSIKNDINGSPTSTPQIGENTSNAERFVYGITRDAEGGMWFSTFYGGVIYVSPTGARFQNLSNRTGLGGNVVEAFAEDDEQRIWIGTDDGGVSCYDPHQNRFVDYPGSQAMRTYNVHKLLWEHGSLWMATYGEGIVKFDTKTGNLKHFTLGSGLSKLNSYCIYRDGKKRLWATDMTGGVYLWNKAKQAFAPCKQIKHHAIIDILEDKLGNVWFASQGDGLWCLKTHQTSNGQSSQQAKVSYSWKQYLHNDNDSTSINDNRINSIAINHKGEIFIATDNGIAKYNPKGDKFSRIQLDLARKGVANIIFNQDEMWLSMDKGIYRCIPGESPLLYDRNDGLESEQFLPNAGLLASDGKIYLGTNMGAYAFYPYQIKVNKVQPSVFITSFDIYNKPVEVGSDKLPEALSSIPQLDISYGEDMFSLSFASLSYISPEKNQYAYRLDGFDKDWIYSGSEHKATYTNLSAGTYTFRVKATNNDGIWSKETTLKIVVHPPFWWSWPAKLFYLLLIGATIYLYTQMKLRKEKRRHLREIETINERKEQEIRDARLKFFTMIAHEIRTPVSLIIGPLENLKQEWKKLNEKKDEGITRFTLFSKDKDLAKIDSALDVIDRNAQRLLDLINQLLDFNKVQQAGMQMHFKLHHVAHLMAAVAERFEPTLAQHGASLEVAYPDENFVAMLDGEAVTKILSNLMSNANKYTHDHVWVKWKKVDDEHFCIQVADNGDGINPDEQQKIFSAFYQAKDNKPGTGIGLSIVKNLVEAHHGKVEVESEIGKGTIFTVTLPIQQEEAEIGDHGNMKTNETVSMENKVDEYTSEKDGMTEDSSMLKPSMLVVEDDDDMRQFIATNFSTDYHVHVAKNGVEALALLEQQQVTLIVSDWMMPEMDGAELCRKIRQNTETSHIPFIMLTAKTDNDSKTESMECGADAYIEKPFSMKYLEACIRNLIDMRRLLQSKYSHSPLEPIGKIATNKIDNDFLEKINRVIEENLNNPCLSVVFIAEQMNMSRSSLFAKVKALVDVTPNEMIQIVKLKKAAALLQVGEYRINEVCYMVGFSSPSYFAKCFQKQFGMKPGEFIGHK